MKRGKHIRKTEKERVNKRTEKKRPRFPAGTRSERQVIPMRGTKHPILRLAALAAALLLTACGGTVQDGGEGEKVINLAFTTAWGDFNPYYTSTGTMYELALYDKLYDKLAFTDMAGAEILPRAAKSWDSGAGGKAIVFHLDENARWSDGEPVTAADWVFTVRLLADPASAFTTRLFTALLSGTNRDGERLENHDLGAQAVNDFTLVLTFKDKINPEDFLLRYNREFLVLPEHLLKDVPPEELRKAEYWQNPVGSGPCVYVSQVMGSEMILAPNPYYHLWAGNWDRLILRVVDSSSRLTGLMSGDIDQIVLGNDITADDIPLAESNGLSVRDAEVRNFFMEVCINEANIPREKVRQALHYAIDKEAVIAAAAKDVGIPAYSYEMPNSPYYDPGLAFPRDVEKAKALLKEANYDGRPYTIAFAAKRENIAALLTQQWKEAGINVEMVIVDVAIMFSGLSSGIYDLGISGHSASAYSLWFETEFPANNTNATFSSDQTRDSYVERISTTVDHAEKVALVKEYQKYLAEQTWFIPLYFAGEYWVESHRVSNIRNSASLMCNDNVWEWYVN